MTIKTYYRPEMSVSHNDSYSPSAGKPAEFANLASKTGAITMMDFEPATAADLAIAHSSEYISDVLTGHRANGFGNHDPEVAQACLYTTGSMIAAAREAAASRSITCSPSSGFHHAGRSWGHGFCTFNGLAVAALKWISENPKSKVAILDCDYHHGDGTEDVLSKSEMNTDRIIHLTAGKHFREADQAELFFSWLEMAIHRINSQGCDLVIYQAGGDQHIDDPLGGLLTTEEMIKRDRMVFNEIRCGIAWNLAGGYQRDEDGGISKVIVLHMNTLNEARKAQRGRQ